MENYTSADFDRVAHPRDFVLGMIQGGNYRDDFMAQVEDGLNTPPGGFKSDEDKKESLLWPCALIFRMNELFHQKESSPLGQGHFAIVMYAISTWASMRPGGWSGNGGLLEKLTALGQLDPAFVDILRTYPSGANNDTTGSESIRTPGNTGLENYTSEDFDSIAPRMDFIGRMQHDRRYIRATMKKVEEGLQPSPPGEGKAAKKDRQVYLYMLVKRMIELYDDSLFENEAQRPEDGVFKVIFENIGQWGNCHYPTTWYNEDRKNGLLNKLIALGEFPDGLIVILKSYPSKGRLDPSKYHSIPPVQENHSDDSWTDSSTAGRKDDQDEHMSSASRSSGTSTFNSPSIKYQKTKDGESFEGPIDAYMDFESEQRKSTRCRGSEERLSMNKKMKTDIQVEQEKQATFDRKSESEIKVELEKRATFDHKADTEIKVDDHKTKNECKKIEANKSLDDNKTKNECKKIEANKSLDDHKTNNAIKLNESAMKLNESEGKKMDKMIEVEREKQRTASLSAAKATPPASQRPSGTALKSLSRKLDQEDAKVDDYGIPKGEYGWKTFARMTGGENFPTGPEVSAYLNRKCPQKLNFKKAKKGKQKIKVNGIQCFSQQYECGCFDAAEKAGHEPKYSAVLRIVKIKNNGEYMNYYQSAEDKRKWCYHVSNKGKQSTKLF